MSYVESLWLYTVLVFGIIIVPGMDMLFVVTNALTGGRQVGLAATSGIMLGGAAHTLFGAAGVAIVLQYAPSLFTVMLFAGAAYMAWIGATLLKSAIRIDGVDTRWRRSPWTAFRQGLVTCLINPKAYLFVISVFPQFIKPHYGPLWRQALAIGAITVLMQLAVYGSLALAAGRSRDFLLARPQVTIAIGRAAGVLFVAVAILTAWQGWMR